MNAETILTVAAVMAVSHLVIMRIALAVVDPARVRLARVCSELLASPSLTETQKAAVEYHVDHAFSGWFVAAAAAFAPLLVILKLFGARFETPLDTVSDPAARKAIDSMTELHVASLAAANPYFMLILLLEMIVFLPFYAVYRLTGKTRYSLKQFALRLALLLEMPQSQMVPAWR